MMIRPFAVTTLAALLVGLLVAVLFAKKQARSVDSTLDLALYLVIFGFPISYITNGLLYAPEQLVHLLQHPSEALDPSLGWSMFGGIAGAIIGAWVWRWRHKASILEIGDAFAFAGPFGWSIARFGCFITHDHPGRVSDFVLAVADYRTGSHPYEPRHDLGLYEALLLIAISSLFVVMGRKPHKPGFYVGLLPLMYAPCRFLLDFLRAPAAEGGDLRYAGLTPAQYGSMALLIASLFVAKRVAQSPTTNTLQTPQ